MTCDSPVNSIAFNPSFFWIGCGTEKGVMVFDIESNATKFEFTVECNSQGVSDKKINRSSPACKSLAWSVDGHTL